MKLEFSKEGYLIPFRGIEASHENFKNIFVDTPHPFEKRKLIFSNYEKWLAIYRKTVDPYPKIWLNGSFVTKSTHPRDLDIVVLIDYLVLEEKKAEFDNLRSEYKNKNAPLDMYPLRVFPPSHRNYNHFIADALYWEHQFTKTRIHKRTKKQYKKGFLKLNYERDTQ